MKKRLIAVIVAISLVLVSLGTFLVVRHVRNNRPPALEDIRERTVALIEASHEINEIFWGEGLKTYPRVYYRSPQPFYVIKTGDGYAYSAVSGENTERLYYYTLTDETHGEMVAYQYCVSPETGVYVDVENGEALTKTDYFAYRYAKKSTEAGENVLFTLDGSYYYALPAYAEPEVEKYYKSTDSEKYDYVRTDERYLTTTAIKERAEAVYANDFLSSVYESMFTGITVSENVSGTLLARYIDYTDSEGVGHLMKSNTWQAVSVARVYLFDTMRMSERRRSNARDVFIDIDTYVPGNEEKKETVTVSLTLQNGSWFLNSATY